LAGSSSLAPDLLNSCTSTLGKEKHIGRFNSIAVAHDTTRRDATRHGTTYYVPRKARLKLRVWNVGMWASLAPAKGRQIMTCDLCGGQKAKKEGC